MLQKMQQQATPIPTTPPSTSPVQAHPIPTPSQQSTTGQQHHGGFITGRQAVQQAQNIPLPNVPENATSMRGSAHQGIPVPRPAMQQSTPMHHTTGHDTTPAQPQHMYPPPYSAPHNMPRTGMPPQTGIPVPRAAPGSTPPVMAQAAQPMSFPGRAPHFAPREQPFHTVSRPAYPVKTAKGTPYPYKEGPHPARGISLLKTSVIVLLAVVGFIGIYYVFGQIGGIPAGSETISQSRPPVESTAIRQPSDKRSSETLDIAVVSVDETSAVIKWQTDRPTTSQIILRDADGTRTQTEPGSALARDHRLTLSNLEAGTTYQYTVISIDADGNEIRQDGKLTTAKPVDTTSPVISAVEIISITESSITVTWSTDEAATSQIEYGKTSSYGTTTPLDKTLTTSHSMVITGLSPSTEYHFTVKSTDANGNEAISDTDNVFRTTAPVPIGTEIGNRAPDFTLRDINGNSVSLHDFKGKIVIVNLWATWCEPCIEELPYFQEVYNAWSRDKLVILAVHVQQSVGLSTSYAQNEGFTFPVLLDTLGTTAKAYTLPDGNGIPRTFFIDEKGIVRKSKYGSFQNKAEIESVLNSL